MTTIEHFCWHVGTIRLVEGLRPEDFQQYRNLLLRRGLSGRKGLGPYAIDRSVIVLKAMFEYPRHVLPLP